MSKMTQAVNNQRRTGRSNAVENFMGEFRILLIR